MKKIKMSQLQMRAVVVPESIDTEKRTVDIIWSVGARVKRWDFHEELSMDPKHVKLDRLNNGAPFLWLHDSFDFKNDRKNVLGVIVNGRAKVENGQGHASILFSKRDDVEPTFSDVKDGILQHVSVGYNVKKYIELEEKADDGLPIYRAVDWEPLEISLVPIGADDDAKIRSRSEQLFDCEITTPEEMMKTKQVEEVKVRSEGSESVEKDDQKASEKSDAAPDKATEAGAGESDKKEEEKRSAAVSEEAVKAERVRVTEINNIVDVAKLDRSFADKLIKEGTTIDKARALVFERLAVQDQERNISTARVEKNSMDKRQLVVEGCRNALLNRYDGKMFPLTDCGKEFRNLSLLAICKEFVEQAGANVRSMSSDDIITRALTTTDLPYVFADVANKSLLAGYSAAPKTYTLISRNREVDDFKDINVVRFGGAFGLEKVGEDGEVKHGKIDDEGEKYFVETFSRIINLTRKMIINNDVDVLTRLPFMAGAASAAMENSVVWTLIAKNSGQVMRYDNKALFHTDHKNLAASGSVISIDSLSAARKSVTRQMGFDNEPMGLPLKYLFTSAEKFTVAEQFCAQLLSASEAAKNNPFGGKLIAVCEPRLDDFSVNAWFAAGDNNLCDIVETATLSGQQGPKIAQFDEADNLGVKFRITRDFGARVVDHRNIYKNPGA